MKDIYIYRWDLTQPPVKQPLSEGHFFLITSPLDVFSILPAWIRSWGITLSVKTFLKILSRTRFPFGVIEQGKVIQSGWVNVGKCRHYPVEPNAVVVGTLFTEVPFRGRGIATAAIVQSIDRLYQRGFRRFYIDVAPDNLPSLRMIEKAGFRQRVAGDPLTPETLKTEPKTV